MAQQARVSELKHDIHIIRSIPEPYGMRARKRARVFFVCPSEHLVWPMSADSLPGPNSRRFMWRTWTPGCLCQPHLHRAPPFRLYEGA